MSLRDAIVATNHLVPLFQQSSFEAAALDRVLPQIQAEREPEIIKVQQLQRAEIAQGELLRNYPLLRYGASRIVPLIPLLQHRIRQSWIDRQLQLRRGVTQVSLTV